jgi:hypothetical protein
MSEDNTLAKVGEGGIVQKFDDKALDDMMTGGAGFLPYIQLMTDSSKPVKRGEFPVNHYALVANQTHTDLGKEVDVVPLVWRPRAVEISDEDGVLSVFDNTDPEFIRIQEIAAKPGLNGCMCGPEYLLWLAQQQRFATFLLGSKSAKREAPNMSARLVKGATLKSKFIETKKYNWWAPVVVPCTADIQMPDAEEMQDVVAKFNDPPKQQKERAEEPANEQAR